MADEGIDLDGVIATLEAKISAMQEAVLALRKAKDALGGAAISTSGSAPTGPVQIGRDTFTGHTILQASERYLRLAGRPARTTEDIVEALTRGGMQKVSSASVASILIRSHNGDGPVVRVQKGLFGLADWYPKRPPKTGRSVKEIVDAAISEATPIEELIEKVADATDQRVRRVPRTPVR